MTEFFSIKEIQKYTVTILVFFVVCGLFFSPFIAWSIFIGGVLVSVNFWFGAQGVKMLLQEVAESLSLGNPVDQQQKIARYKCFIYLLHFTIRIAITGIILFLLIRWETVNILGLIMGLSTIVATVTAIALRALCCYWTLQNQRRR